MKKSTGIYWLKRDFRLLDNPALTHALRDCDKVTPLFIAEPSMLKAGETSGFHLHAIEQAFNDVRSKVNAASRDVYHAFSEVVSLLESLYNEFPFQMLYSHEEVGINRTYQRDLEVQSWCKDKGVKWIEFRQTGVFRRLSDRDKRGKLWRTFYEQEVLPAPDANALSKLSVPREWQQLLNSEKLTFIKNTEAKLKSAKLQRVSETDAHETMRSFLNDRGIAYSGGISSPLTAFTAGSRMSVHLAWGTISGRFLYQQTLAQKEHYKVVEHPDAGKWRRSLTSFQARLHWRDHFIQRLETEPQMEFEALNAAYEFLEYDGTADMLKAWESGTTGFPMVDACMRCLAGTGFVNFRMRAMITSFACHVLHLSWKDIDHPMAKLYTDYEPGIHLSQLQMQASVVGINTIRIYNPTKQIVDHDPNCIFIKEWIPELRMFSSEEIIAHGAAPLGDYPAHIVDYPSRSKEMRSQLWSIKGRSETKALASKVYIKHGSRKGPSNRKKKK